MKTASSLPARATAILNNKTAKHIDILDSKAFKLPRLLSQRILYALFWKLNQLCATFFKN